MLHLMDQVCLPGKLPCEDAAGWGNNFLFVLDGASGLTGTQIMGTGSDAAWFASGVRDGLCRRLADGGETAPLLAEILAGLRRDYEAKAASEGIPLPSDAPSAGLALFREVGEEIEFFGLGDCVGVAELAGGGLAWSCDSQLPALDGGVLSRMAEIHRDTGVSVLEARQQCQELLVKNRAMRNVPGGYWILDLSALGLPHARVMRWKRREVVSLSAFSDGFGQLVDPFRFFPGYEALHRAMGQMPLQTLADRLFQAQEEDPQANRFPRFKLRDDTCALWARVE